MHQAVDLAPAPLDAQKLDEVEHEHFAIAKIYADAFEETSVDLPEVPEGAASQGDAARVLLDADHANSTPPMSTHQAIYQWLEPQDNEETIAETIAETMVETIAETGPLEVREPSPRLQPRLSSQALAGQHAQAGDAIVCHTALTQCRLQRGVSCLLWK